CCDVVERGLAEGQSAGGAERHRRGRCQGHECYRLTGALTAPLTLMLSVCTVRLPPTVEAPNTVADALVRLALPLAPLVLSDTASLGLLAVLVSVMVASEADVAALREIAEPVCDHQIAADIPVAQHRRFIVGQADIATRPAGVERRCSGQQVA